MKNWTIIIIAMLMLYNLNLFSQEYQLVWSDEFEGNKLDSSKWEYMIGDGTAYGLPSGWGNNEQQWYTDKNITIENGKLVITALKENISEKNYSSCRIRTLNKGDWTYGRFEFRAKFPIGQGIWPAIWMMPTDNEYGGWAASGEIDIVEYLGHEPNVVYGTLHYGGIWPNNTESRSSKQISKGNFHDDFHDFALEWENGEMRWYVDGEKYGTQNSWWTSASGASFPAPFDKNFYLIINLAIGGNWPGSPDDSTQFPQRFELEYVRVYQIKDPTSVEENMVIPSKTYLNQNYPNPFNPSTIIRFRIDKKSYISLEVYDLMGNKIRTLMKEVKSPGIYNVTFEDTNLPSGIYFYRLLSGGYNVATKKMVLIK